MAHVLLVDDDAGTRSALARFVGRQGHTVIQAMNAAEAVAELARGRFDLVIGDFELPGGTGLVVLEAGLEARVPVIAMTAHGSLETATEAMRRGAAGLLVKPFTPESVAQALAGPLGEAAPRRAARTPESGVPLLARDDRSGRVVTAAAGDSASGRLIIPATRPRTPFQGVPVPAPPREPASGRHVMGVPASRATLPADGVPVPVREGASGRIDTGRVRSGTPFEGVPVPAPGRDRNAPIRLIGEDDAFREVLAVIDRVADTDATILLTGESGTGKEVVARAIHDASLRRDKLFVAVNCGAIPEGLLESELFGHVRGAFTGAVATRRGRFAAAEGGTLFLDEIGDMPAVLQVKLLRVIQERQYEMLGDHRPQPLNVRIIAATNRALEKLVATGRFREDLYYRLNVVPLRLPPLRARPKDIPLLVHQFIAEACATHLRNVTGIEPDALALLVAWHWPGNVRELYNVVERMVVLRGHGVLTAADVPAHVVVGRPQSPDAALYDLPPGGIDLTESLARYEAAMIEKALERTRGNRTQAAQLLRINRTTLVEKLRRIGLPVPEDDDR